MPLHSLLETEQSVQIAASESNTPKCLTKNPSISATRLSILRVVLLSARTRQTTPSHHHARQLGPRPQSAPKRGTHQTTAHKKKRRASVHSKQRATARPKKPQPSTGPTQGHGLREAEKGVIQRGATAAGPRQQQSRKEAAQAGMGLAAAKEKKEGRISSLHLCRGIPETAFQNADIKKEREVRWRRWWWRRPDVRTRRCASPHARPQIEVGQCTIHTNREKKRAAHPHRSFFRSPPHQQCSVSSALRSWPRAVGPLSQRVRAAALRRPCPALKTPR